MKEEKDIEKVIRGKLENYGVNPPPHIWDNVQAQLRANRRKSRMVYIRWVSAAAVILLAVVAGWYFNQNMKDGKNNIVKTEILIPENEQIEKFIQPEIQVNETNTSKLTDNHKILGENSTVQRKKADKELLSSDKNIWLKDETSLTKIERIIARVAQNQHLQGELAQRIKINLPVQLSDQEHLLIAENIRNIKEASKPENNWKMGMYISPGYSSYSSSYAANYSQNMNSTGSDFHTNVGGGISVQYKTSKRWVVESGVYYAQNGQHSESSSGIFSRKENSDYSFAEAGSSYFTNRVQVENNNLSMNSAAGVIQFSETPKGAQLTGDFEANNTTGVANLIVPNGEFSQVFDFMEIPLYVRYRLVDNKIGIELLTGLNTGIIVGNNAYLENQFGLQNIGETRDISTFNVSGTLGLGMNYALGKHLSVAVEPRFSYYLNSISNNPSVDFRPYRIGFFTGLTYDF